MLEIEFDMNGKKWDAKNRKIANCIYIYMKKKTGKLEINKIISFWNRFSISS